MNEFVKEIVKALNTKQKSTSSKKTTAYDTTAEVVRVEDSTVYVHIDGGADETPCQKTISCKTGDSVKIRVSGGKAWITGNVTAPPTDDSYAQYVLVEAQSLIAQKIEAVRATIEEISAGVIHTGQIIGNNFKVSKDGKLTAKEAEIEGKIESTEGTIGGWTINEDSISTTATSTTQKTTTNTYIKDTGEVSATVTDSLNDTSGYSIVGNSIEFYDNRASEDVNYSCKIDASQVIIKKTEDPNTSNEADYYVSYTYNTITYGYESSSGYDSFDLSFGIEDDEKYMETEANFYPANMPYVTRYTSSSKTTIEAGNLGSIDISIGSAVDGYYRYVIDRGAVNLSDGSGESSMMVYRDDFNGDEAGTATSARICIRNVSSGTTASVYGFVTILYVPKKRGE